MKILDEPPRGSPGGHQVTSVCGPAILHSPVLASCGVGRELGQGALVVVPGPATDSLLVSTSPGGCGAWLAPASTGGGLHPAARAFLGQTAGASWREMAAVSVVP